MQRDGRLAAPCDALDDECVVLARPDDRVLFRLYGRHDIAQLIVLVFPEPVQQKFVRHGHRIRFAVVGIDHPLQNLLADDEISFQIDEPRHGAVRRLVAGGVAPAGERVEQAGGRRPPIDHEQLGRIGFLYAEFTDIHGRRFGLAFFLKVEPAEIRFGGRLREVAAFRLADRFQDLLRHILTGVTGNGFEPCKMIFHLADRLLQMSKFLLISLVQSGFHLHTSRLMRSQ